MLLAKIFFPVHPAADEFAIDQIFLQQHVAHRQQHRRLASRPGRQPVIGLRCGVRETRVNHAHFRSIHFAVDNSLRVRIEIVSCFEVRTQQQNEPGLRVIGRWPVETVPEGVSSAGASRTDIGVAVVPVNTPRMQHALVVYEFMPGAPNVVHDFVLASFLQSQANAPS